MKIKIPAGKPRLLLLAASFICTIMCQQFVKASDTKLPFRNLDMEAGTGIPEAWKRGFGVRGVDFLWDHTTAHSGKSSLCLKKAVPRYFPIADWSQEISVDAVDHPRKLHVEGWIKAQRVTKAIVDIKYTAAKQDRHAWAIYIGQKSDTDPVATYDWKFCEGTVEVPANTSNVGLAFEIYGPGAIWFDDFDVRWVE